MTIKCSHADKVPGNLNYLATVDKNVCKCVFLPSDTDSVVWGHEPLDEKRKPHSNT